MLNYVWSIMILAGIVVAAFNGRLPDVTNATIESAKEAVTICITMLGILSMWTGLTKIAEDSGLIDVLTQKMSPIVHNLFPSVPKNSMAIKYISTNIIANMLGLGWAATPAGLKAMEELQKLNKKKDTATKAMCMFLIVNMSSLQIVSINILAYRSQYNSANPSEIVGPGLLATIFSTIIGVLICKIFESWSKE
jgi:spore maturation protein A